MITLVDIFYKNFGSVGASGLRIELNSGHSRTMIIGDNGAGKSTLIDAICFGLFGKSFRGSNKPTLVNIINKKNMLVEITIETKGKKYLIRRGMKPNIFEIYMDGVLINQTASPKDYQKYIEENVMKMNFKSFKQIVVLGSNNYNHFMELPAGDRREIVEDLLDISVVSRMNVVLKAKMETTRENIERVSNLIKLANTERTLNQEFLTSILRKKDDRKEKILSEIETANSVIDKAEKDIEELVVKRDEITQKIAKANLAEEKKLQFDVRYNELNKTKELSKKYIEFYRTKDYCPACKQPIEDSFKATELGNHETCLNNVNVEMEDIDNKLKKISKALSIKESLVTEQSSIVDSIMQLQSTIHINNKLIRKLESDLEDMKTDIDQEMAVRDKLEANLTAIREHETEMEALVETREIETVAYSLLKDNGFKTNIIQRYIPIMNKLINEYLSAMDFYVNFTLDENFNETIKSRYRDEFSYENFSKGEQQRIDLAILFAWRQIAKMKNSMACNILILDETFDSSMDGYGIDVLVKIMYGLDIENIFCISHNDSMIDKFDRVLKFEKVNNFTVVKEL